MIASTFNDLLEKLNSAGVPWNPPGNWKPLELLWAPPMAEPAPPHTLCQRFLMSFLTWQHPDPRREAPALSSGHEGSALLIWDAQLSFLKFFCVSQSTSMHNNGPASISPSGWGCWSGQTEFASHWQRLGLFSSQSAWSSSLNSKSGFVNWSWVCECQK